LIISTSNDVDFEVDETDAAIVTKWRWRMSKPRNGKSYIVRSNGGRNGTIYLHRFLLDAPKGVQVDHTDGNALNNRRDNLRLCTPSENACNRGKTCLNKSGYKGVSFRSDTKKCRAQIEKLGKIYSLGSFNSPQLAHAAYVIASVKLHGEFAR